MISEVSFEIIPFFYHNKYQNASGQGDKVR
jgi:hypothetical protein